MVNKFSPVAGYGNFDATAFTEEMDEQHTQANHEPDVERRQELAALEQHRFEQVLKPAHGSLSSMTPMANTAQWIRLTANTKSGRMVPPLFIISAT